MRQYLDLCRDILEQGEIEQDRTGTGTISLFGPQMVFDLQQGFPLLTTKKVWFKGIVHELIWILSGSTNIRYLLDHQVHIWDEWADGNGDLGPVYGKQWRSWEGPDGTVVDQISRVAEQIVSHPASRRLIVNAWNPAEVDRMALPPCHTFFQFYVRGGKLSCKLYQRSADVFLGVPFNMASYALLTMMMAQVTGLTLGVFIHTFGDAHIYLNHREQVELQLTREPRPLPTVRLNPQIRSITDFKYEDVELLDYHPHPAIKGEVSV